MGRRGDAAQGQGAGGGGGPPDAEGVVLLTYLLLAADKPLTEEPLARKATGIAFEKVQLPSGGLPLMSEVGGCPAPQVANAKEG